MCGGDVEAEVGVVFGACDSCGVTSTLPKANDEKLVNLFNRANHYRRQNEFDKAMGSYEAILNEDTTNAEAHWCIVLCRYGIEYVEDPRTHERVPTCHRTQYASVLTDADYIAALDNAQDSYTRGLYEAEAKKISEIQKSILAISKREEPYDVFICYKETTDGGSRTQDSVLAQDIYYQLKNDGYRVFFAKISLEDKLGQEYEPYIFAALNSAKVMLVVGTSREHFTAVWVRNEWSRFLSLMKGDRSKLLIPCYRDMDAYDLPEEFSHLQAQDMSKIGFIQDITRGVKKVLDSGKAPVPASAAPAAAVVQAADAGASIDSLLKRAALFLEDADYAQAVSYCERVLDVDPENAMAYLYSLYAESNVKNEEGLWYQGKPLDNLPNYKKFVRFATPEQSAKLVGYNQAIHDHIAEQAKIAAEKEAERNRFVKAKHDERAKSVNIRRWIVLAVEIIVLIVALYNSAVGGYFGGGFVIVLFTFGFFSMVFFPEKKSGATRGFGMALSVLMAVVLLIVSSVIGGPPNVVPILGFIIVPIIAMCNPKPSLNPEQPNNTPHQPKYMKYTKQQPNAPHAAHPQAHTVSQAPYAGQANVAPHTPYTGQAQAAPYMQPQAQPPQSAPQAPQYPAPQKPPPTVQAAQAAPTAPPKKVCDSCGNAVKPGKAFCGTCGASTT